jgi:hypothetical protein
VAAIQANGFLFRAQPGHPFSFTWYFPPSLVWQNLSAITSQPTLIDQARGATSVEVHAPTSKLVSPAICASKEQGDAVMQKAYLYEAILLVNQGIDKAVQGLERLKRMKNSGLNPEYFDEKLALFEVHRALLNGCFCNNVETSERRDEAHFAKKHREHEKRMLDEVQVYQDVKAVEQRRRLEGKAPKVQFLGREEAESLGIAIPESAGAHDITNGE